MPVRTVTLLALLFIFQAGKVCARDKLLFKHHTFELSVTPAVDYHFVTYPARTFGYMEYGGYDQFTNKLFRPFVGANFGVAYVYRPSRYFGISTGLDYTQYNIKMGKTIATIYSPWQTAIVFVNSFNGYISNGYFDVPVLLHSYCIIKGMECELATGPEFVFPVISLSRFDAGVGTVNELSINDNQTYSTTEMKQESHLGWAFELLANAPIKKFVLSVGPELKLLTAYPLDPGPDIQRPLTNLVDFYLGVKVGFRFGG